MLPEFNSKIIKCSCLLLFLQACAYFNTFYNAEEHFANAEKLRIQSIGSSLSAKAIQEYGKAIEKSDKILVDYSDSDYVEQALLLKGKSHFFRREYDSAREVFMELENSNDQFFVDETKYWLALCKWKDLKPQPAINDLKGLLSDSNSNDLNSRIYLVLGEIFLEIEDTNSAFNFLSLGAETSKDRLTREQIYFQIANLSFDKGVYKEALDNYKKVLNNSISVSRIRESNLKIIQSYRLMGESKQSKERIDKLLLNDDFNSIKGDLRLESIKIDLDSGNTNYAIENLDIIAQDYPNTVIAIEAYYILSVLYLESPNLNFEKSNFFMNEAMKQNANSSHKVLISGKSESVVTLIELSQLLEKNNGEKKSTILYRLGEILAFDLGNKNDSIPYFNNIVNNFQSSDEFLPSIFALYTLNKSSNDVVSNRYKEKILKEYPNTDFAKSIINDLNLEIEHNPTEMLVKAENLWLDNKRASLKAYKDILGIDASTESSNIAAYFLGYYYDYELSNADSAIVYYKWLVTKHASSKQSQIAKKRLEALNVR